MKVLSIEQMTKLKELGVDTDKASVRVGQMIFTQSDPWYGTDKYDVYLFDHEDNDTGCFNESYRTFTLEDVFNLLPKEIIIKKVSYQLNWNPLNGSLRYDNVYGDEGTTLYGCCYVEEEGILFAAYNVLIWALENGHLKTK